MRLVNYFIIVIMSTLFVSTISLAKPATMSFQIIQDQLILDKSTITSAEIVTNKEGSYAGLQIILNSSATKELSRMTNAGIGKDLNIVLNDRIVSTAVLRSSLQSKFILAGISKNEANIFINSLKK